MRKCDFEEVGGFDEDFTSAIGEDTEFGARWEGSQGKILFLPQLRAHYFHDVTVERTQESDYSGNVQQAHSCE